MACAKVLYFSGEIPQGDPEGDQRVLFRKLHLLSKESNHAILAAFLEAVTNAVKDEVRQLSREQRMLVPAFESVLNLTDHVLELRKTPLGGAVERMLVFVFQLGSFIAQHEANPLEYDFTSNTTSIIARGPGLLTAAAIGLSPSILMLPSISKHIARVAWRFGIVVDQVCRSLEVSPDEINAEGAWVYCAHGADEREAREAVAKFNALKEYPETSMATVFNVDGRSVSVGGPPSTLKALFSESDFFQRTKNVPMKKVQGSWHNSNAYGAENVLQCIPEINTEHRLHLPVFSPVTGEPIQETEPEPLLRQIMEETLTQRIRWDLTIEGVTNRLKQLSPATIELTSVQPSHYMDTLLEHWRTEIPGVSTASMDVMTAVTNLKLENSPPRDTRSSKLAVVGMSCRFPGGADDAEKFWELLEAGRDVHTKIPADRFDIETHVDPSGEKRNTSKTPYGCFVNNPGLFDAMFFGMSPREAEQTDPMQRLALVTAYEALENSGFVQNRSIHRRRIGTYYGQASDDYREVNTGQDVGTYFIPGGCRAFGPGRINYFFNFWGPSFSIDTACSSSLAAIQAACSALWSGDVDMAITGGMNILTNSDVYAGLSKGHFLSPTGNCKTWDEGADGYCRADGVGSVVIKRLEDAEADNDNILAVVLSAATDHSAEAVSITHPHDVAQAHLYTQVARRAGIDPLTVGYVEMHGTGTQAGDGNEMRSVTNVFAPNGPGHIRQKDIPLHVGSVKSNVGHGEAAAGIMAFVKTMLVLKKGMIPPHVGIKTRLNPSLPQDLAARNVTIPYQAASWARNDKQKRIAMINNFGAAGGNTAIMVEEAPLRPRIGEDTRQTHPITVSAKTAKAFQANIRNLVNFLEGNQDLSIADLSYTTTARKMHFNYRISVPATSRAEAIELLRPHIETSIVQAPCAVKQAPVAFAFTGQGTFYTGIGAQLYKQSPIFRREIDQLDSLARRQNFGSFLPVVTTKSPPEEVPFVSMQLSIMCVEIALARLWRSYGIKPSVVIGHSLGEYAALVVAGVISDSDAIHLLGTRAVLLESKCTPRTHGMVSVRASVADVKKAAGNVSFEISCINSPKETVIGGPNENLETISEALIKAGHKPVRLDVIHAYHTSQMDVIAEDFMAQTKSVVCKKPKIPVIAPRHGKVMESDIDVAYLSSATRETVDFVTALGSAWDDGFVTKNTIWLEMGHHPCVAGFVKRTLSETRLACHTLHRDLDNWTALAKALCALFNAGMDLDWNEYHQPFESALRLVEAPAYAWDNKDYWMQYRGDWNLTKGVHDDNQLSFSSGVNGFSTTAIHKLCSESYDGGMAQLVAEVNVTDPSLQGIVDGHAMNGNGVASSFLHAEMAFTLAERIRSQALPGSESFGINVSDFEYHEPVVKMNDTSVEQLIVVSAEADLDKGEAHVKWYNPANESWYCHATVTYEDSSSWMLNWARSSKLVTSRIQALNDMAAQGKANKLTTDLAYSLFGKLVDYSDMYRTMKSVILNEDEAVAEVEFPMDTSGTWTVPPHFIDGCVSLSGFILNGGTHFDNVKNFYITPSWKNMRFAKPLTPGGKYLAYVQMSKGEKNAYVGDVYILDGTQIVGVVEAIVFLEWPRVMLNRFFKAPDAPAKKLNKAFPSIPKSLPGFMTPPRSRQGSEDVAFLPTSKSALSLRSRQGSAEMPFIPVNKTAHQPYHGLQTPAPTPPNEKQELEIVVKAPTAATETAAPADDIVSKALVIVAEELAVDLGLLMDDAEIADFGLDSLMSLVISQKLRDSLGIEIRDAFFLEAPTVGEMKKLFV